MQSKDIKARFLRQGLLSCRAKTTTQKSKQPLTMLDHVSSPEQGFPLQQNTCLDRSEARSCHRRRPVFLPLAPLEPRTSRFWTRLGMYGSRTVGAMGAIGPSSGAAPPNISLNALPLPAVRASGIRSSRSRSKSKKPCAIRKHETWVLGIGDPSRHPQQSGSRASRTQTCTAPFCANCLTCQTCHSCARQENSVKGLNDSLPAEGEAGLPSHPSEYLMAPCAMTHSLLLPAQQKPCFPAVTRRRMHLFSRLHHPSNRV